MPCPGLFLFYGGGFKLDDDLTTWLDVEVYPRLTHEHFFADLPGFRRSGHGFVARCPNPAHDDRHPSFYMPDGRPIGYCFSCGYTITWWQTLENRGLSGRQVIVEFARLAGVPPLPSGGDPERARAAAEESRQVEEWWRGRRAALWQIEGADVLDYLRDRGYPDDLIRAMDIGIHPGPGTSVPDSLRLPPPEYRLLIPARSRGGKVLGFAGRRLDGGEPKYQYSPGLPRSSILWGIHRLRRSTDAVVVVEGVLDAETLATVDIAGVVSIGGAQATKDQVKQLSAFKRVVLALDADDAGRAGTEKLIRSLMSRDVKVYVVTDFCGAKDPDELLRRDGPDAVQNVIRDAVAGYRWLVRRMAPPAGATEQERDAALERALDFAETTYHINPLAAREILDEAAAVFGLDEAALVEAVERLSEQRREHFRRRKWEEALEKARQAAKEGKHDSIPGILREAQDEIATATETPPEPADLVALEARLAAFPDGLRLPWVDLNSLARVDRGGMTVFGAATSAGKSTLLYNLILFWLQQHDGAFIFWSGEVASALVYARLLGLLAGINMADVLRQHREGMYSAAVLAAKRHLVELAENRLYLLDGPVAADGLAARVRAVARRQPVVAVLVDYLQMLAPPARPDGGRYGNREQEVTATAKALHELAVELDTAVVAAAQVSRNNFQYAQRPRLTDLRESGAIEQYATSVWGVWNSAMVRGTAKPVEAKPARPTEGWYWTPDTEDMSEDAKAALAMAASHGRALLEVSILKSRWRGNTGKSVPLMLCGETGAIDVLPSELGSVEIPSDGAEDRHDTGIKKDDKVVSFRNPAGKGKQNKKEG